MYYITSSWPLYEPNLFANNVGGYATHYIKGEALIAASHAIYASMGHHAFTMRSGCYSI